jgi:ribose transport system ATP-binding protein
MLTLETSTQLNQATPNAVSAAPLVRMRGITKAFGSTVVLKDVSFDIFPGEVHVLAGENGAGKSTLIKILGGVHTRFDGTIELDGKTVRPQSPLHANSLGVAVIYQELSLVPSMSVVDNIFLGRAPTRFGFVRTGQQRREIGNLLGRLGIDIDFERRVEQFSIGTQQLIEIAKALAQAAKVIIMDEPTSALNAVEVEKLFGLIADLKRRGCGIVYITHKMEEISQIADRITVLRDGLFVGTAPAAEVPISRLVHWMIGREVSQQFPRHTRQTGRRRLMVEGLTVYDGRASGKPAVEDVSFAADEGEIVGIGGLQGSGASQLLHGLYGDYGTSNVLGHITLDGERYVPRSPRDSITRGMALLTNDRKANGLVLSLPITANSTLAALPRLSPLGWRRARWEREATARYAEQLRLRGASIEAEVRQLSGGNQQKVAIAKCLAIEPRVLLLDEPTRGIDIGAKRDIYELMNRWTAEGITILLITSELPELLALSDRIVVLHRGKMTAELTRAQATADIVLQAAMGQVAEQGERDQCRRTSDE